MKGQGKVPRHARYAYFLAYPAYSSVVYLYEELRAFFTCAAEAVLTLFVLIALLHSGEGIVTAK